MYKEEFFINNVDLITGACIIMELILLFAIFLFLLIKSCISQKKKWSSFSTLILMGHLLSLVFFHGLVSRTDRRTQAWASGDIKCEVTIIYENHQKFDNLSFIVP